MGYETNGQLGLNDLTNRSSPTQVGSDTTWPKDAATNASTLVIGSGYCTTAIKTDGTLWTWGENQVGQLGDNSRVFKSSPVQVPGTTWKSVSIGDVHATATKTDGTLWVWGGNNEGVLGLNNNTKYSSPVQVPGTNWNYSACGNYQIAALKTDGTLWVWGQGGYGALGQNDVVQRSSCLLYTSPSPRD